MKRILLSLVSLFLCSLLHSEVLPVETYYLPEPAQILLVSHFKDPVVDKATLDTKDHTYQVLLKDGKQFTFDYFGDWLSIDCIKEAVPLLLVPRRVRSKVARSYGFATKPVKMVKHKQSHRAYIHVKLNNGKELTVDFN